METFKSTLLWVIVGGTIIGSGYWAFSTLDSDIAKEETLTPKQITKIPQVEPEVTKEEVTPAEKPAPTTEKPTTPAPLTYQSLITEVQKLLDDKVVMQLKSQGQRVGTIQKVLNIYNNTNKKVDNDYGASLKADVLTFQKAEGVTQTGQTGPLTYQAMINWLKKQ